MLGATDQEAVADAEAEAEVPQEEAAQACVGAP